jgi:hypothetical protein
LLISLLEISLLLSLNFDGFLQTELTDLFILIATLISG